MTGIKDKTKILPKEKKLEREGDIIVLLEVTVQEGYLMERYASIEVFRVSRGVIGSTTRRTIVNNLAVIVLQLIMTPSFIFLDMFDV